MAAVRYAIAASAVGQSELLNRNSTFPFPPRVSTIAFDDGIHQPISRIPLQHTTTWKFFPKPLPFRSLPHRSSVFSWTSGKYDPGSLVVVADPGGLKKVVQS